MSTQLDTSHSSSNWRTVQTEGRIETNHRRNGAGDSGQVRIMYSLLVDVVMHGLIHVCVPDPPYMYTYSTCTCVHTVSLWVW